MRLFHTRFSLFSHALLFSSNRLDKNSTHNWCGCSPFFSFFFFIIVVIFIFILWRLTLIRSVLLFDSKYYWGIVFNICDTRPSLGLNFKYITHGFSFDLAHLCFLLFFSLFFYPASFFLGFYLTVGFLALWC